MAVTGRSVVSQPSRTGGDEVLSAPQEPLRTLGLRADSYLISIARIEPDNGILTFVRAFSRRPRGFNLVVLGNMDASRAYDREVREAASGEVIFPGAIYDQQVVKSLRFHARAYCHGHIAGGVNPSLVEALWCGNPVIASRNRYNAWTAGPDQFFFSDEDECAAAIDRVLVDMPAVAQSRASARAWARQHFSWEEQLMGYQRAIEGAFHDRC